MAHSPQSDGTRNIKVKDDNNSLSYFKKTVTLQDWWLIKAEADLQGRSIAVAGFTSRQQLPLRMFRSAPITKRYDVFTIETADGITVILQGFINKLRTTENGFSAEVLSHFLFGFPLCWEESAKKCLVEAVNSGIDLQNTFDLTKPTTDPVSAARDTEDSGPLLTPSKPEGVSEDENNIKVTQDCSLGVSETETFTDPNLHDKAIFRNFVEEKSNANTHFSILNNDIEGMKEPSISGNDCHPSSLEMPVHNDVDNAKNDGSMNLPPSLGCHMAAVSSVQDSIAVQGEPSGYHVVRSSERIYNTRSIKKSEKRSLGTPKAKASGSLESNIIKNDASMHKDSNMDSLKVSNFDQTLPIGTSNIHVLSSMEDSIAVQAEPSGYHAVGSFGSIVDSQSSKKSKKSSAGKSKTKGSASLESINLKNDAFVPQVSNMENLNFDEALSIGTSHIKAVSSMQQRIAVQEPSGYHVVGSSERIDYSQESKKSKRGSISKSNTKGSTILECITIKNDASMPKDSMDNPNVCNFDQTLSIGTSVSLDILLPKCSKNKQVENERNNGLRAGSCHAMLRFIEANATYEESLSRSPTVGGCNVLNQSECHIDESAMFSTLKSGVTPSTVERNTMDSTSSNAGYRRNSNSLRNSRHKQKWKHISGCSVKRKAKELLSKAFAHQNEGNPKRSSYTNLHSLAKMDVSEAMLKAARRLKNMSGNLKSEERNEKIAVEEGGSSRKKARRKISFDTHVSPFSQARREKTCVRSPESLSLKRSRAGRLLLPSLDFWRNQIPVYDANRNITGIQEELMQ